MKYLFIGTEQDLIDNGFRVVDDYEIKAIRPNKRSGNTFVSNDKILLAWDKEDIKDLIDKMLLKEITNE